MEQPVVPTQARLKELFIYDATTGIFTRVTHRSPNATPGRIAGGDNGSGYTRISIDGRRYYAHRLAWLFVHGEWPKNHIDHINGNPADNRITNLRDVPQSVNLQNLKRARRDNNSSGLLGVSADKNKWASKISVNGRQIHIGTFATTQQAHEAYLAQKRKHHIGNTL